MSQALARKFRWPIGSKVKVKRGVRIGARGQFEVKPDNRIASVIGYDEAQGNPTSVLLDQPICGFKIWDSEHLESA